MSTRIAILVLLAACGGHKRHTDPAKAAAEGAGAPFDATSLASPITLRVEEVAGQPGGDCGPMTMRVHLIDAGGKELAFDAGIVTGMADPAKAPGFLAPADNAFADMGSSCGGLRQGHTIKAAGDTVVSVDDWADEQAGPGTQTLVIAKLPKGATVTVK